MLFKFTLLAIATQVSMVDGVHIKTNSKLSKNVIHLNSPKSLASTPKSLASTPKSLASRSSFGLKNDDNDYEHDRHERYRKPTSLLEDIIIIFAAICILCCLGIIKVIHKMTKSSHGA